MNKITTCWCNGKPFMRVSKKRFENFIRFFEKAGRIEGNSFMGWSDWYDWSLNGNLEITKDTPEDVCWDNLEICNVAREYFETPHPEYYLRLDYIKDNNYDLDTIVPKERKKRLTKKQKMFAKVFGDAFDELFREEAIKSMNNELIIEALKKHIRVNVSTKAVELYNDYGVKMVLRDLDEETYDAFKETFQNF